MKIIKIGTVKPWWIGKEATCSGCGKVVELEEGDQRTEFLALLHSGTTTEVWCRECQIWSRGPSKEEVQS